VATSRAANRVKVSWQSHNITDLFHEEGIGGKLKGAAYMGFKAKGFPHPAHGHMGKAGLLGHSADPA
jgi:hypothetical protein